MHPTCCSIPACAAASSFPSSSAFFFAMLAFSHLTQSRATNGFHALPVRRETIFLTAYLTGLFCQLSTILVTFLLGAAVSAPLHLSFWSVTGAAMGSAMLEAVFFLLLRRAVHDDDGADPRRARLLFRRQYPRSGNGISAAQLCGQFPLRLQWAHRRCARFPLPAPLYVPRGGHRLDRDLRERLVLCDCLRA